MTFKLYYKRFLDGINKPVICSKNDDYHLVDFSILKADAGNALDPNKPSHINKAKEVVLKSNGGKHVSFKDCYTGDSTITWNFTVNVAEDGTITF